MRTSAYAVPNAAMQRQVHQKMPITPTMQMAKLDMISEDTLMHQVEHMAIQAEIAAIDNMNVEVAQNMLKYQKPKVATLSCYNKPNSDTKMLMIGPVSGAIVQE